jgi:pimeloyl-ACP methyl ester carboxylesterase
MTAFEQHSLHLWQGTVETRVEIAGAGPPLVFLHGPWGLVGDRDFLGLLAAGHRLYAPWHPGTTPGNPDAIHRLDDWLDLVVYCGELFDRLGLDEAALVGHSVGGLLACELAAAMPRLVTRLVLIDPLGLWREDLPVRNWMILPEDRRAAALFADPAGPAAARFFALPAAPAERVAAQAAFIWTQACTGKFVWPLPDKASKSASTASPRRPSCCGARPTALSPPPMPKTSPRGSPARRSRRSQMPATCRRSNSRTRPPALCANFWREGERAGARLGNACPPRLAGNAGPARDQYTRKAQRSGGCANGVSLKARSVRPQRSGVFDQDRWP